MPDDPYNLQRFVDAQANVYAGVVAELRRGQKQGHWIWFIFPQIQGLGYSEMSRFYALGSLDEARAYLQHPVLGPRLEACVRLALEHGAASPESIFGGVDALKFRSSMTLFAAAAQGNSVFSQALETFYHGQPDARTLKLL